MFAAIYGEKLPVFDVFPGALQNDGETLTLIKPGATSAEDIIVDKVKYEITAPWPTGTTNGAALQLIDAAQDNSRVCNWSDGSGWRFASYTASPGSYSQLYLYLDAPGEVYIDDLSLVAGTVPAVGSNYIKNGDFELPLSTGWRTYGNVTNSVLSTSEKHSGNSSLRFIVGSPAGVGARLFQTFSGLPSSGCTLSFWYLPSGGSNNLNTWMSSSFMPKTALRPVVPPSPGTNNPMAATLTPIPPLWINEVQPLNLTGPADTSGNHEPWLELYNAGTNTVSLEGFYLTDDYAAPAKWAFPSGAVINPGEFKVIFADGDTSESSLSELHAGFRLTPTNGSIALVRMLAAQPEILDYVNYSGVPGDYSYGSVPDGQPFDRILMFTGTPGHSNVGALTWPPLRINEWMASNGGIVRDPADNQADDWFEIYNPTLTAVNLTGWSLTDTLTNLARFDVPQGYTVPALGYLLVWADGEPQQNSTTRRDLHVNFKLERNGEAIGLFAPDGSLVDAVTFGYQTNNVSQGRIPDGGDTISFFVLPSPGSTNIARPPAPAILEIHFLTPLPGQLRIAFSTVPGLSYRVDYKNSLADPTWTALASPQVATSTAMSLIDLSAPRQRFYRVVIP